MSALQKFIAFAALTVASTLAASAQNRDEYPLPVPGVPASVGVNIHFTKPRSGEMEQLAAAGFRWIRMDFDWAGIEKVRGRYDFSAYDGLMSNLRQYHIRPIFILDYGNDVYEKGPPRSDEAIAGFARFAAASVTHFKNQGVVWEMWNEPNGGFWPPKANVDEYIKVGLATGKAIRAAAPEEWYVGPGVSGMDFDFMEKCFKEGMLKYWDAVSFHPYRDSEPESAAPDFQRTRDLIEQYAPAGKHVPILSSEWGYSERYSGLNIVKQSQWIVRQQLNDVANGLVISIWYDWHDDGTDPKETEHHFGTVFNDYKPKPTYQAISTLTKTLAGSTFKTRITTGSDNDFALLFFAGDRPILAAWTTEQTPHSIHIPSSPGLFKTVDYVGAAGQIEVGKDGLDVTVTNAPQYFIGHSDNTILRLVSHWKAASVLQVDSPRDARAKLAEITAGDWTPQDRAAVNKVQLRRFAGGPGVESTEEEVLSRRADSTLDLDGFVGSADFQYNSTTPTVLIATLQTKSGAEVSKKISVIGKTPLHLVPQPAVGGTISVRIENPTGVAFQGRLGIVSTTPYTTVPVALKRGQTEATVKLPIAEGTDGSYAAGFRVERQFTANGPWVAVNDAPMISYQSLESFAADTPDTTPDTLKYAVVPDGDPKVASEITMHVVDSPPGLADGTAHAVKIDYDFAQGWKFLRLEPRNEKRSPLDGSPQAFGAWVYGDGSGDVLNARYADSTGQTFQPSAGKIVWKGWRFVSFSLRGDNSGHWGGADDGTVHYPIHFDSMLLVDSPGGRGGKGTIYATDFTLMSAAK